MGRFDYNPAARRQFCGIVPPCSYPYSFRNLFYDSDKISPVSSLSGNVKNYNRKKGLFGKKFNFRRSGPHHIHSHPGRHGKSCRGGCRYFCRRRRSCFLDVDYRSARLLAQIYKEKDPLYGGYRGGPAYYIHHLFIKKDSKRRHSLIAILFAISGLICWCGISQVIGNSVSSAFTNAFRIPPIYTTVLLVIIAAVIVLRKNATVKVLDVVVPIMAGLYFLMTLFIIFTNIGQIPAVFQQIFSEAFGLRQVVAGGFGAVLMNGAKRGLFSNEAGSGSAPCAAAAADISHPAKEGLLQAFGVFIDTIVICSCSAMIMLLTPAELTQGLAGMDLLQAAMNYHMGSFGVVFIAVILWLFSFSTFIGILFYARPNVAYLFGDNWLSQNLYKILALVMLFIGGLAAYTFVWDLGDIGIGLMTIFNMIALVPLSRQAIDALKDYEHQKV